MTGLWTRISDHLEKNHTKIEVSRNEPFSGHCVCFYATRKFAQQQINLAMNLLKNHSYREVEKMTGISKSTLTRNKRLTPNV